MAIRVAAVLICNRCKTEAPNRFAADQADPDRAIRQWMQANGWQEIRGRDLCPTCLMDVDASRRTSVRVGAR